MTLSPAYPGSGPSWKLIAVVDPGEHVVGEHAQVGDAEQHVGRVLVEPGGELGAVADDGDALLGGEVADDRVRRRDEHRDEAVRLGDLDALRDQRLVADEGAAPRIARTLPSIDRLDHRSLSPPRVRRLRGYIGSAGRDLPANS